MRRLGILGLFLCLGLTAAHAADPPQRFVVYFLQWSAALDDAAVEVIGHAADYVKAHRGSVAHVTGFADPTGSKKANKLMANLRAQVVIDQLQKDGVAPAQTAGRGRGAVQFALTSQESRRVEIAVSGH